MNLTILNGAHYKTGMTTLMINEFIRGARSANPSIKITRYDLIDENYSHCLGCGQCMGEQKSDRGNCAINDKATEMITNSLESDIVVFATPIYEYCVSSTMKKFLERCLPLAKFGIGIVGRIKPIKGKTGVIICSSGAPFPINHLMGITWYPSFILKKGLKFMGCSNVKSIFAGGMGGSENLKKKYMDKAYNIGYNLTKSI